MKYCIDCKHFADANYSKTYISPRCKQLGDDDCAYMRHVVCGIEGELYEPNAPDPATPSTAIAWKPGGQVLDV